MSTQAYNDAHDLNVRTHIMKYYRLHSCSWFEWLGDQLVLPDHGRFLELGGGPGDLWQQKEGWPPPGQLLCLSDLSAGMVREARQQLPGNPAIAYAVLDAGRLPFVQGVFTAVFAFGVLDQLADQTPALSEIHRTLSPGGVFYTSTGGPGHLHEIRELIQPFLPEANYGGDIERFGLQNGAAVLAPFFAEVELRPYQNHLLFQEAYPLLAYALSEPDVRQQLTAARLEAFEQHVESVVARQGEIRVTINKGLFIARSPH
ncbi:MAG: class I SAM-dependent methyltransferase [Anaerolineaceae bacterium]|nr:class I SAM-dependent methyltransferase [Anaerolineaceae bacterium]